MSEVFLRVVESGLQRDDTCFANGTFRFRQVCRNWNEVAIGSPQLWVRWVSGAFRAWPLFRARSKEAPIFLTWRTHQIPASGLDVLADPAIPGRIRQLDFIGTSKQLEQALGAFNSSSPSNALSIRLHVTQSIFAIEDDTQDHVARFLPFSFPKLSKLDIENFQPDSSSPLLTTSNLTSLRLSFHSGIRPRDTLAQFSRLLQKHPNLEELDLEYGAMPRVEPAEDPAPITLPRLVDLKLHGTAECILGLVNLIDISIPLQNVFFQFCYPRDQNVPALVDIVKKLLAAYYECEGLVYPRKASHLTVESWPGGDWDPLVFMARSHSAPASIPRPVLKLQFYRKDELMDVFPLFPLDDTREFTMDGLFLSSDEHYKLLQRVKGISRLELAALDIGPVFGALDSRNRGASKGAINLLRWTTDVCTDDPAQRLIPKLVSLTLSRLDFLHGVVDDTLDFLQGRRNRKIGLKRLVIRSCRVHRDDDESLGLEELVKVVRWINSEEMGSDYERSDGGIDSDEFDCYLGGYGRAFNYYGCADFD